MTLQNRKWSFTFIAFTAIAMLPAAFCRAQVLLSEIPGNKHLQLTEEQYQQGHYESAAQSARQYLNATSRIVFTHRTDETDKANYYVALSGLKMETAGCTDTANIFLTTTTSTAYKQRVSFGLAQYYFRHDEFASAIPLYEAAGISNLNNNEIVDQKFELAYCYFNNKEFNKAEPLLQSIKEVKEGKYYRAGNYYYGLLAYNQNKYRDALRSFERIQNDKDYRSVVPYYIAEIYYFMGNRQKALKQADTLIKAKEKSFYDNELHLLAAQCLFEEQRYEDAKPYFEYYYEHTDKIRKEDLYEMAYCYYKTSEWQNAVEKFKMLSDARDSLGQTSMYLLGDCYLKVGDKQSARNAFGICADMNFNVIEQEASMILYARISYEMGYHDEALRQLNTLLATFPNSEYKDEANTLISGLLIKTNNYADALKHLESVSVKDKNFHDIYQRATFGYAVQQFRDGEVAAADKYLSLSLQNPVNADYEDAALFWKGEVAYRLHHYADVITYSQNFVSKRNEKGTVERISPLATIQHAYLNMGYAAMETQNYNSAQNYFSRAQQAQSQDAYSASVALLREADAVFMQKNYSRAIVLYDKIITTDSVNADYARYQKSILLGLEGKNNEKISVLQALINSVPPSAYANYARYEIAVTYIDLDKYAQALPYLHQLTDSISDKSFAAKAWMKTGFIYQQLNENNMAIEAYKHVVTDYPGSDERIAALDALRSLYIQSNQPAAYSRLLKENKLPSADSSSVDSTYYAAAETQFAAGKWDNARQGFTDYLQQYPNGIFAIKSHYYRAESNYQLKKYKEALEDYKVVLSGQWNDFFENSARHAANIAYEEKDYPAAFAYFLKLRMAASNNQVKEMAYAGLMKSAFNSDKFAEAGLYADSLLAFPGTSAETINDALYYKAKTFQRSDNLDSSMKIYRQLSGNKNGEIAAESRFHIAEILLAQSKFKEAEDAANEAIHLSAGYDYWIVKSYILLADILIKQKDYFNAKATLESIVKHTKIAELKQEATKKLEDVKKMEKKHSKLSEE
jgi:tetratricopeptide (TPR) repeat protein